MHLCSGPVHSRLGPEQTFASPSFTWFESVGVRVVLRGCLARGHCFCPSHHVSAMVFAQKTAQAANSTRPTAASTQPQATTVRVGWWRLLRCGGRVHPATAD